MKGYQCGNDADCTKCQYATDGACPIFEELGNQMVANHVLKTKLVNAGKVIGQMADQIRESKKKIAALERKVPPEAPAEVKP